jgi:hypothetical protein
MAKEALRRLGTSDEQIAEKTAAYVEPIEIIAEDDEDVPPLKDKSTQPTAACRQPKSRPSAAPDAAQKQAGTRF